MVQTTNRFFDEVARLMNNAPAWRKACGASSRRCSAPRPSDSSRTGRRPARRVRGGQGHGAACPRGERDAQDPGCSLGSEARRRQCGYAIVGATCRGSARHFGRRAASDRVFRVTNAGFRPSLFLRIGARARWLFFETPSCSSLLFKHDLFRKPASTFRDHAL